MALIKVRTNTISGAMSQLLKTTDLGFNFAVRVGDTENYLDSVIHSSLIADILANWNLYTVLAGVWKKNGTVVPVTSWSVAQDAVQTTGQQQAAAVALLSDPQGLTKLLRAVALILKNQINLVRANTLHPIVSITRSVAVATVTTLGAHGFTAADVGALLNVSICGADVGAYNGIFLLASVPSSTTFTYAVAGSPVTPATGSMFFAEAAVAMPRTPQLTGAAVTNALTAAINAGQVDTGIP